jgi:hypothetical protein
MEKLDRVDKLEIIGTVIVLTLCAILVVVHLLRVPCVAIDR